MIVKEQEHLSAHTTFRVGGPAKRYYIPETLPELSALVQRLHREGESFRVIGNGSNLLVSDRGVDFSVIEIKKMLEGIELLSPDDAGLPGGEPGSEAYVYLRVLAGTSLGKTAQYALQEGFGGMEGLAGIPGTIGGAVVMNAGAYGYEMKDILVQCEVLTEAGESLTLPLEKLALSYRHSIIEESRYIVTAVVLRLQKAPREEIEERMQDFKARRQEKQPLQYASAGSTFRRPEGYFAGKLIEDSGLKGYSVGDAAVSEKHAGFVVNKGTADAAAIYGVIAHVQETVLRTQGVLLEPEVKLWGSF